jgi:hypothetical protein
VRDAPGLVADAERLAPEGSDCERDERQRRDDAGPDRHTADARAQQRPVGPALGEQHRRVGEDEEDRQHTDLPVVLHDEVDAERLAHPPEAGDERELQRHLPEPDEAERQRQLEREAPPRRPRRRERHAERREREDDVAHDQRDRHHTSLHPPEPSGRGRFGARRERPRGIEPLLTRML